MPFSRNVKLTMKPVSIYVRNENGRDRLLAPVCLGVPIARGVLNAADEICLLDQDGNPIISQTETMVLWPDRSIRWLKIQFCGLVEAGETHRYSLVNDPTVHALEPDTSSLSISTQIRDGLLHFNLPTLSCTASVTLKNENKHDYKSTVCSVNQEKTGPVVSLVELETIFYSDGKDAKVNFLIEYFRQLDTYRITSTVHNPSAATHANACWDLGDDASLLISEFGLSLCQLDELQPQSTSFCLSSDRDWISLDTNELTLLQASSGGENWQHANHVNADGVVDLPFSGFRWHAGELCGEGGRAQPLLHKRHQDVDWFLSVEKFWQNFPIALESDALGFSAKFMANSGSQPQELQGGEQKTYRLWLQKTASGETGENFAAKPLMAQLEPDYIASTLALDTFALQGEPLDRIIALGLHEENGFAAKRELIDEYGWRSFGDIVADHESHYLDSNEQFVSHYNNQYDPLYGFLRQYLVRGEDQWAILADDLVSHVSDIDIYHTKEDRAEYNHGLFWHTDHYLDAFSATHRTYSRHQQVDGEVTGGGGPGDQHCYSRGLCWHYLLTGEERSAREVIGLAAWVEAFIDGDGGVLSTLHHWRERKQCEAAIGDLIFRRNHYSMDRGTGNFINSLLDSYLVSADVNYLDKAAYVIENTFSASDDITLRQFNDVERTWFYTVFLQSVIRYVEITANDYPAEPARYGFSLAGLMHYASWMADHERPAMTEPEHLDFPNETWDAQEIRKAYILFYAASCIQDQSEQARFKAAAQRFYTHVLEVIGGSDCGHYSRIQAILMQNHGLYGYVAKVSYTYSDALPERFSPVAPGLAGEILSALLRLRPGREIKWLSHRIPLVKKLYDTVRHQSLLGKN